MSKEYISAADTAKLIRAALKRSFPAVKFSVRSKTYSGGASINVDWTDGPTTGLVEAVAGQYAGSAFDGSIDMKVSHSSWLLPDGTIMTARNPGSTGSMGHIEPEENAKPHPDAREVRFMADFVFCNRKMTPDFAARALACVRRKWGDLDLHVVVSTWDGSASISGDYQDERRAHEIVSRFMSVTA